MNISDVRDILVEYQKDYESESFQLEYILSVVNDESITNEDKIEVLKSFISEILNVQESIIVEIVNELFTFSTLRENLEYSLDEVDNDCNSDEDKIVENIPNTSETHSDDMLFLIGMFPNIKPQLLKFCFEVKCCRDKQATSDFLLDNISLRDGVHESEEGTTELNDSSEVDMNVVLARLQKEYYKKQAQQQKSVATREKKLKHAIVKKYGNQSVLPKYDDKGKLSRPTFDVTALSGNSSYLGTGGSNKLRFLNNEVVAFKGEKCIFVKPDNYDEKYSGPLRGKENKGMLAKQKKK